MYFLAQAKGHCVDGKSISMFCMSRFGVTLRFIVSDTRI